MRAIQFKCEFSTIAKKYTDKIKYFTAYFNGILNDSLLKLFLKHLLNVGNYMNANSFRGGAYGFRLDCIEKTYTLLGHDSNVSLFEYLLDNIWKSELNYECTSEKDIE